MTEKSFAFLKTILKLDIYLSIFSNEFVEAEALGDTMDKD